MFEFLSVACSEQRHLGGGKIQGRGVARSRPRNRERDQYISACWHFVGGNGLAGEMDDPMDDSGAGVSHTHRGALDPMQFQPA